MDRRLSSPTQNAYFHMISWVRKRTETPVARLKHREASVQRKEVADSNQVPTRPGYCRIVGVHAVSGLRQSVYREYRRFWNELPTSFSRHPQVPSPGGLPWRTREQQSHQRVALQWSVWAVCHRRRRETRLDETDRKTNETVHALFTVAAGAFYWSPQTLALTFDIVEELEPQGDRVREISRSSTHGCVRQ